LARDLHGGAGLPCEASDGLVVIEQRRQQEFDGDLVVEVEVTRGDDDAHAPDAEHALDAVLAREDRAFAHSRRQSNVHCQCGRFPEKGSPGGVETCSTAGAWSAAQACGAHQACTGGGSAGAATCVCNVDPTCKASGATCAGGATLDGCSQDAQGCFYAATTSPCTNGACFGGAGSAQCCTNACTNASTRCGGLGVQTCSVQGNGCTAWNAGTACASAHQSCTGAGTCTCNADPNCRSASNVCRAPRSTRARRTRRAASTPRARRPAARTRRARRGRASARPRSPRAGPPASTSRTTTATAAGAATCAPRSLRRAPGPRARARYARATSAAPLRWPARPRSTRATPPSTRSVPSRPTRPGRSSRSISP